MLFRPFALLLLLTTLFSCCPEQDLKLSPALNAWIPYYGQQEISFVNAAGQKITFVASLSHFDQEGADKVCGSYAIETRQLLLTPREDPSLQLQVTLSHEILVGIQLRRKDPAAQGLDVRFNTISQLYISDPWRDRFYKEIALNGQSYQHVLHAHGLPEAGPLSFAEMYYGQDSGLIGFRLFSGDWFFRE